MEITGLDIALRRMDSIEKKCQSLVNTFNKPDVGFQKILDAKLDLNQGKNVSTGEINQLIDKYSQRHGIDSDFVRAVVKQESGFNEKATSRCGAMGLMQLMPSTANSLGVTNAYDAEQNIEGGTKYLKGLLDRFGNNKELALAAYNAGPNAVKKYGGIPPYQETQGYVKNVLSMYGRFKSEG